MSMQPVGFVRPSVHNRTLRGWVAGIVLWTGFSAVCPAATGWFDEPSTHRMVFARPRHAGMQVLASVALPDGVSSGTRLACFDGDGVALPFRVVNREERAVWLLVSIGLSRDSKTHVYFGGPDGDGGSLAELVDPVPVRVSTYRSDAQGIPNTWEKMRFMVGAQASPIRTLRQQYFGDISSGYRQVTTRTRGGHRYGAGRLPILKLETHFRCPEPGTYRLALNSRDVSYLLLDGELSAFRDTEGRPGAWEIGKPVYLSQGVHHLEVFHKTKSTPYVSVGWVKPGEEDATLIPHQFLLSATLVDESRIDRRDDTLHPDIEYEIQPAYAFRDCDAVFVPVDFSAKVADADVTCDWDFGDGATGQGTQVRHVYKATGRYPVTLSIRQAEKVDRTATAVVDCRLVRTRYFVLAPRVMGLPPVCYATDPVEPLLLIEGTPMRDIVIDVEHSVQGEGIDLSGAESIRLGADARRLPIVSEQAGLLSRIEWTVSHRGVPIRRETIRFVKAPFADVPASVDGERLRRADGDRLVLVPFRSGADFTQEPISLERAFGQLACIDDSLAVSGMFVDLYSTTYYRRLGQLLNGPGRPIVTHETLRGWSDEAGAYGPLLRLLDAPAAAEGADVAVVSVGLPDMDWDTSPAEFERHVAALVDLLSATHGCPVVLATPPPYRGSSSDVRAYAAAIQRVAQARNIPVADIYSAFMNAGTELDDLFVDNSDFVLSGRGHHLVARVMARAILMQAEEDH